MLLLEAVALKWLTYIIQPVRGHRVSSTKQLEEVMGVEVIANEPKHSNPDISLHPVLLVQRFAPIRFAREEKRH